MTPGIDLALLSSKLATLVLNTGASMMTALNMPGIFMSVVKSCLPVSLSAVSTRGSGCPAIVQVLGSFNVTVLGSGAGNFAAAEANLPKVPRLPEACDSMLFSALISPTGTFHSLAAACFSMASATAEPRRTRSCASRMPRLPVVTKSPHCAFLAWLSPGVMYSHFIFFQSAFSSSAAS